MIVLLSTPQFAIVRRVHANFEGLFDKTGVCPMFRQAGAGMSVGLAYSEAGRHFIVRETIPQCANDDDIDRTCGRLIGAITATFNQVMDRVPDWLCRSA